MSIVSAMKPTTGSWLHLVAWGMVVAGVAGVLAVLASPATGVLTGLALAVIGLVVNAFAKASRKMDQIFSEELD
ncbi:hypothetical protein ABZ816_07990 [Actinosynnema sp. NPDC047251]|uniref:Uncharacterized protein n=1 Tax=Saccharothrix espanaensis (strain ATCC 51144 / DSM 44229 / JCM 9112 / NBRC 15066 / NRRL 15764) TaxID=1179773 RepID=K0JNQ6_SACES|nr:hypothetical protein [Saccharothrix espanaensis]CCH27600.1 hypothetical protein BN6_02670 [Saccharothrix espanaensis DSM 44229]